ncbi:unnamed protein product [Calicophoron daubneyi]|uniref:acetyl-CoA C-acetyltransferase n=1 Tax=Calicophoron daubneyi TaxID=300641 RepID=A0AAV2THS0_CALDB
MSVLFLPHHSWSKRDCCIRHSGFFCCFQLIGARFYWMKMSRRILKLSIVCATKHIRLFSSIKSLEDVVIIGVARTPLGSFQKSLASFSAPKLGAVAISGAVTHAGIDPNIVQECYMGLVISALTKQAPAKQAALLGGLHPSIPCTSVNKLCASGMKSIMIASQAIATCQQDVICAGGMESMSNAPFYLRRNLPSYGGVLLEDSLLSCGLTDAKYDIHMGLCAEKTAADMKISREEQDEYAKMSYQRSQTAASKGVFQKEIVPVRVEDPKAPNGSKEITEDEEYTRVDFARFPKLKTAFLSIAEGGTITAANASTLNDGGAATILSSASFAAKDQSLKPIARVVAYADDGTDTIDFPIAPHLAVKRLLKYIGLKTEDIDLWEINEAFAVVVLANARLLNLPLDKVNVHGGAVSCGHPLGASGARITNHLALQLKPGQKGIATVCNGGGGASAILLEGL